MAQLKRAKEELNWKDGVPWGPSKLLHQRKACQPDLAQRYASAVEMHRALREGQKILERK